MQLDEAVVKSLRHWDQPLRLGRGPLRRLAPNAQYSHEAGRQIRAALVDAMQHLVRDLDPAEDIEAFRIRTYLRGLLSGRSDREIGGQLGLSRQTVNLTVRWQAASAVAEILATTTATAA
ncbi:MAG: hypothetical protein KGJ86_18045 [Chloroflexota bacterium]|nr:hypothetical protein [Chloroflexota bacterium]